MPPRVQPHELFVETVRKAFPALVDVACANGRFSATEMARAKESGEKSFGARGTTHFFVLFPRLFAVQHACLVDIRDIHSQATSGGGEADVNVISLQCQQRG